MDKSYWFAPLLLAGFFSPVSPVQASGISITHTSGEVYGYPTATVRPTPAGWQTTVKDSLNITTDEVAGYSLYISMVGEDNSLVSESGNLISATSATTYSPAKLSPDSWGFAVPSQSAFATILAI